MTQSLEIISIKTNFEVRSRKTWVQRLRKEKSCYLFPFHHSEG